LTHRTNCHSAGTMMMLSGRSDLPPGFDANRPRPTDWPSIPSIVGAVTAQRHNLPPAAVLPDRILQDNGRVVPGQFAGVMGAGRDPWFIEAAPYHAGAYGAYPTYEFDHRRRPIVAGRTTFQAPDLSLPEDVALDRLVNRLSVLRQLDEQRRNLDR